MISNDFEYQLQKASPTPSTKNAPRQMKHFMRLSGANMSLIKLVHNERASTSSKHDTLQPFVVYSLNKKDRWQISDKMSATVLENLQEPDNKVVVVVERQFDGLCAPLNSGSVHTHLNHLTMSKVRSIYQMDPEFSAKTLRGAGRKNVEIEESPDVSYNIFKTPSNYTKLYANKTLSTMGYYQKRNRNHKKLLETEIFDEDEDRENLEEVEETQNPKFYNLSDHFVEKPRRKKESNYHGFLIV